MKIKLALLDSDQNYLNRIVTAFNIKYADKLEIYSFTKLESAMAALEPSRIDVLVASDTFVVESSALPKRCQLAYFVESADVDSVNDQRAICKFQKADLIYRQILSIYSEYAGSASGLKLGDDSCKVIAFTSPCGGVGSSTMAAACALHYAARGKRTLYLNFERFGSSDAFFAAEGQFDMSGIIFALKSKKTNLSMKMESCVKQDPRGVYFYSQSKVALDMLELGADEIGRLISEARLSGNYEYVIADLEFGMDRASLQILRQAGAIVWTGDGSEISNRKLARAYQALTILEQNAEVPLTARIALIYNKFSNKSGTAVTGTELRSIGGAPRYEHAFCKWAEQRLPDLCESGLTDSAVRADWVGIATEYNEKIKLYGKRCGLASGLGTTVTALLLTEQRYYIINVGDTRAYEIGDHVALLTKDQTVVAREVELGNLTQVEAETDSRRSVLLQCVGASDEVYPDMFFGDTALNATYMLCSDGFRHEITEGEIYAYLNPTVMTDADGMQRNMEALIELNKQRRERDNISVVTIRTF